MVTRLFIALLLLALSACDAAADSAHRRKHFTGVIGLSWNESTDTYTRIGRGSETPAGTALPENLMGGMQAAMKRCVVNDDGVVLYYLCPTDSTKKADCTTAANLDGTDGQVMVEIPKFYHLYWYENNTHNWVISPRQVNYGPHGTTSVHGAFKQGDTVLPYRYIGAYEGSLYDVSEEEMVSAADVVTNMYASGDKLCSVSGYYPKSYETRDEFRNAAAARGTGWSQIDLLALSAIQILYLIEYADFDSQSTVGMGRTYFDYELGHDYKKASNQGDGCAIARCGHSNDDGNFTGATDRAEELDITYINLDASSYYDYMSYRGIENLYGNLRMMIDGININNSLIYYTGNSSSFADDTSEGYTDSGITVSASSGYIEEIEASGLGFFPSVTGGSSSVGLCDTFTLFSGWRGFYVGGSVIDGFSAGMFQIRFLSGSSSSSTLGSRLSYLKKSVVGTQYILTHDGDYLWDGTDYIIAGSY